MTPSISTTHDIIHVHEKPWCTREQDDLKLLMLIQCSLTSYMQAKKYNVWLNPILTVFIAEWFVVKFTEDQQLSKAVKASDLEDENGVTGDEKEFTVGNTVQCPWIDSNLYQGDIVFESSMLSFS